jgi:hypothetical protein
LVWRGDENKQKLGEKNVGPLFLAGYEFPPALMLFSYFTLQPEYNIYVTPLGINLQHKSWINSADLWFL